MKKTLILLFAVYSTATFGQQLVAEYRPAKATGFGYISPTGQEILAPNYKETTIFEEGFALVFETKEKKWKFIDIKGEALKLPYDNFVPKTVFGIGENTFKDGYAYIVVNKMTACINPKGETVFPAEYDDISAIKNGYFTGKKGADFYVLNPDGSGVKLKVAAVAMDDFSEDLAPFRNAENLYGYVSTNGEVAISAQFSKVGYFHNGLAWARNAVGKVGFIDKKGEWVIQPIYDKVSDFDTPEKLSIAKTESGKVLLTLKGDVINVDGATDIMEFSEGLAAAKKGTTWGFINMKGEWVIQPTYTKVERFYEGFANVRNGEKWGAIDKTGKVIVPVEYERIGNFGDGLIEVRKGALWGFCDSRGQLVIPIQFKDVRAFHFGYAVASTESGWGIIDKTGKWTVEPKFLSIKDINQVK